MTVTLDLPDTDTTSVPMSRYIVTVPTPTPPDQETIYRYICRGITGGLAHAEYVDAVPGPITWNAPNVPNEFEVSIPIDNPDLAALDPDQTPPRELEVWRNGHLLLTGKPTTRRVDNTTRMMTLTCKDPTWYLTKRYVGHADRQNLLQNPSFEAATVGGNVIPPWTAVGTGLTVSIDALNFHDGTQCVKLVGTSVNALRYIKQTVHVTAGKLATNVVFSAWGYISAMTDAPFYGVGLLLREAVVTTPSTVDGARLTAKTTRNRWLRYEATVTVPPNQSMALGCWLLACGGTMLWDQAEVRVADALDYVTGTDQSDVVASIVNYAQGKGGQGFLAPEKSDLMIRPVVDTPSGVLIPSRSYPLADHQKIYDGNGSSGTGAVDEYLNAWNGVDWWFEPAPRLLHIVSAVGVDRTDVTFSYYNFPTRPERNGAWGIQSWTFSDSIEQTANQIVELGGWAGKQGDPSREEGGFNDPSTLGGLTLELVETAPMTAPTDVLDGFANSRGRKLRSAVATPTLVCQEPRDASGTVTYPLIGVLLPGDTIAVDIIDGALAISGEWSIAQVVLDPSTELLTVTPNPTLESPPGPGGPVPDD